MSVHSVRLIVAPNSFPVMPDQMGHLPSAKVVIIIEKRCRSIAFVAQIQTSDPSIPTHKREYEDCKQILKLSLTPSLHIKARARLQPAQLSEELPLWA